MLLTTLLIRRERLSGYAGRAEAVAILSHIILEK
jgi:hypothetical protein